MLHHFFWHHVSIAGTHAAPCWPLDTSTLLMAAWPQSCFKCNLSVPGSPFPPLHSHLLPLSNTHNFPPHNTLREDPMCHKTRYTNKMEGKGTAQPALSYGHEIAFHLWQYRWIQSQHSELKLLKSRQLRIRHIEAQTHGSIEG